MRLRPLLAATAFSLASFAAPALAKDTNMEGHYDLRNDVLVDVDDPWESFNQPIFNFNVGFDKHIFKPFIRGYDYVLPHPVRHSISNVLNNLYEPLNVAHGLLQLNPEVTFTSLWRFILNTTFGLGGLDDFAKEDAGLRPMEQNLGKTLGHWGVPAGPYVVLPILGPSSVRDTVGKVGDWYVDPITWVTTSWFQVGRSFADGIDERDSKDAVVQRLYYDSLDPYAATRSAYRQHEKYEEKSKD